jgi:TPP-dependent pyruvate/acetoin dehydrogenase alpha subunit
VRRYPAYDPPEYVDWEASPEILDEFRATLDRNPDRRATVTGLDDAALLGLYRGLLRFRLHDIALKRWVKQGVISKAWLGTGEEAVTIGTVHALRRHPGGDVIAPMIRNAGACHEMGIPLADLFRAYLGTADSPARGRDLHLGDMTRGVIAPISMVGSVSTVVNGYALAFRHRSEDRVALTWIGDGSTKTGEVHEALNFAAVMKLPVVFVIQNNQVALGTRLQQHHRGDGFSEWGDAYGMVALCVDGNNVLDVHAAAVEAVAACRSGRGPVLIVADTFRMGGHATHDEREARRTLDGAQFEWWGRRDPIGLYEEYLSGLGRPLVEDPADPPDIGMDSASANRDLLARVETKITEEVEAAAEEALGSLASAVPEPGADEISSCYG